MKAVYCGAGTDIEIVNYCDDILCFHFIDSQPFSEYGCETCYDENGKNGFSREHFIEDLDKAMNKNGFVITIVVDNLRIYTDYHRTIYYYTNTSIPEMNEYIKRNICNFDTLITSGFIPHYSVVTLTNKKIHFIGTNNTVYKQDDYESSELLTEKLHAGELHDRFYKFSCIYDNQIKKSFNTWEQFITFCE